MKVKVKWSTRISLSADDTSALLVVLRQTVHAYKMRGDFNVSLLNEDDIDRLEQLRNALSDNVPIGV